ncbi:MAG: DUF91 domain-containing protein [Thermoproteus sp.]|nr:DUF91 domain-containing protein [Thermoproteus sp.]
MRPCVFYPQALKGQAHNRRGAIDWTYAQGSRRVHQRKEEDWISAVFCKCRGVYKGRASAEFPLGVYLVLIKSDGALSIHGSKKAARYLESAGLIDFYVI